MKHFDQAQAAFDELRENMRDTLKSMTAHIGTEAHPCHWQRLQSAGIGAIVFTPGSDEVWWPCIPDRIQRNVLSRIMDAPEEVGVEECWAVEDELFYDEWQGPDYATIRADELLHFGR